jgi:murein L,D-transpeptidase YafK
MPTFARNNVENFLCDRIFRGSKSISAFLLSMLALVPLISFNNKGPKAVISRGGTPVGNTYILVDKTDYELQVFDEEGWYATYPVVFGSKDLRDKMFEGDKRTPDGEFKVVLKKIHPQWGPELLLDYPNEESVRRFRDRKSKGLIHSKAKIGGGIAIHATRPDEEWTVDHFYNWTDGCVSVKYTEMQELYDYIQPGTAVIIRY